MKVKIGSHPRWIGPYQIAEKLMWWRDKHEDGRVHNFGTWLASKADGSDTWLTKFCNWISEHNRRQVYVRVDAYDAWNADHTLSLIALPLLKQLKEHKHGAPNVEDCDVPEHLRSTSATPKESEYDTDSNHFDRWEYVLDEMIWAHYQEANDDPAEEACWQHDVPDPNWPFPARGSMLDQMMAGLHCDAEALQVLQARKQNGFRLFGKYYQNLWD